MVCGVEGIPQPKSSIKVMVLQQWHLLWKKCLYLDSYQGVWFHSVSFSPCGISWWHSSTGIGFSPNTSVSLCHNPTDAVFLYLCGVQGWYGHPTVAAVPESHSHHIPRIEENSCLCTSQGFFFDHEVWIIYLLINIYQKWCLLQGVIMPL